MSRKIRFTPEEKAQAVIDYLDKNKFRTQICEELCISSRTIQRIKSKLEISDSQLRSVEYGLRINDESLSPLYHKGDILFVQTSQKFKGDAILFFSFADEVLIQDCHSENEEPESIFSFSKIPKKELIAYGKIIYCYQDKFNKQNDSAIKVQPATIQNQVKVFVTDNPRYCFSCSSKCIYKHIQYIQENLPVSHMVFRNLFRILHV